ncbi:hypothetical protein [Helicovermis profundi]|uniref:Uncharacterized protein n=1 Tax=Helicovermis profundi TaxID=3065157 RepID=A0AAU9E1J5_9FIRM|nr:hypothetical protein HLPR_04940 [Clostridia bacterium S502]
MKFQLNRKKVILRPFIFIIVVMLLDHLMPSIDFSLLKTFSIVIGVSSEYLTLRSQSEVYVITDEVLILEKAGVKIPLIEIEEIIRRYAPLFHYTGITSEGWGYLFNF